LINLIQTLCLKPLRKNAMQFRAFAGVALSTAFGLAPWCSIASTPNPAPDKVSQCSRLIEAANRAVAAIQAVTQAAHPNATDQTNLDAMNRIADAADRATSEMGAIRFTDSQIQTYQTRFLTLYVGTSRATRSLITAMQTKNAATAQQAFHALALTTNKEAPLVNEVNQYCTQQGSAQ
jgi:hypothetical protein